MTRVERKIFWLLMGREPKPGETITVNEIKTDFGKDDDRTGRQNRQQEKAA